MDDLQFLFFNHGFNILCVMVVMIWQYKLLIQMILLLPLLKMLVIIVLFEKSEAINLLKNYVLGYCGYV